VVLENETKKIKDKLFMHAGLEYLILLDWVFKMD
jgi:hypothetical protein